MLMVGCERNYEFLLVKDRDGVDSVDFGESLVFKGTVTVSSDILYSCSLT